MLRLRGRSSGFTLLELIIVVIVIGILASIALPRYIQIAEKGRLAEAKSVLSAIRSAQMRYVAQYGTFTDTLANLDFQGTIPRFFAPGVIPAASIVVAQSTNDAAVVGVLTRNTVETIAGPGALYPVQITMGGIISSTDAVVTRLL